MCPDFAARRVAGVNRMGSPYNRTIDQQAYMLATNDVCYASAVIFLLLIPMVWLARPRTTAQAVTVDAAAH